MKYILVDQVGPHHWRSMYCHIRGKIWHHDINWNLSASEAYASGQRRHSITGYPVYHKTEGKPMRLLIKPKNSDWLQAAPSAKVEAIVKALDIAQNVYGYRSW